MSGRRPRRCRCTGSASTSGRCRRSSTRATPATRACAGAARRSRTLRELLAGLEALGRLDCCEAVLSGYLGEPGGLELRARGARRRARAAPRRLVRLRSRARRRGRAVPPGRARAHVPRAGRAARRSARPQPLRARVARRPAGAHRRRGGRGGGRAARGRAREKSSSRGSCSTTRAARPSMSSGSTTTARGLRAPRTSPQFWSGSGDVFTALVAGLRLAGTPLDETVARGDGADGAADRPHVRAGRAGAAHGRDRLGLAAGRRARRARGLRRF